MKYSDFLKEHGPTENWADEYDYAIDGLEVQLYLATSRNREDGKIDHKLEALHHHLSLYPIELRHEGLLLIPAFSEDCINLITEHISLIGHSILEDLDRDSIGFEVGSGGKVYHFAKATAPKISYPEYLKSQSWFEFRARIIKQRGFHCELCRSQKNLQVHHLTYERLGSERDDDVMLLCKKCHETAHYKR